MGVAFLGMMIVQPIKREIPGNPGEKMPEYPRLFRRNGVPRRQVSIAYYFL